MIARGEFLAGLGGFGTSLAAIDLPNYAAQVGIAVVAPLSGSDRKMGEALGNGVRAAGMSPASGYLCSVYGEPGDKRERGGAYLAPPHYRTS